MKYKFKKINLFYILIFTIIISFSSTSSFAISYEENLASGEIKLQSIFEDTSDISEADEIKGPFTLYELANEMSEIENITIDEALERLSPQNGEISPLAYKTYYTYSRTLDVTPAYKPKLTFYTKVLAQDTRILAFFEILDISMNRGYNGMSKAFGGDVYINLENSETLYYRVSGDFYDNGTTTISGGVNIGIGEKANFNFDIEHSSKHYEYYYDTDRIYAKDK